MCKATPFDSQQMKVKNFIIIHDNKTGKNRTVLLSAADTAYFNSQIAKERDQKAERNVSILLGDINLGIFQSDNEKLAREISRSDEFQEMIVKAKFFNGEVTYNAQERKILEKWFIEKGITRMIELFTEHILNNKSDRKKRLPNTPIGSLMKTIRVK